MKLKSKSKGKYREEEEEEGEQLDEARKGSISTFGRPCWTTKEEEEVL